MQTGLERLKNLCKATFGKLIQTSLKKAVLVDEKRYPIADSDGRPAECSLFFRPVGHKIFYPTQLFLCLDDRPGFEKISLKGSVP